MGREHGAKTMARICLNHLTERYGPVLAVDDVTVTLEPGKITGFRGPNGAGTTALSRMAVELTRPMPGTSIIDRRTRLRPAQPFAAMGGTADSALSHPRRSGRDTPRGREKSSPAITHRVTRLGLAGTVVLIVVVAVAAAFCAAHGWSDTVQQLVHALRHLPQPVRTLVGGSAWAHLLN
jgi:ABC-type branched-subunit amino acid transport system ATPase component